MTIIQYWGGWAAGVGIFWVMGYFVIKWAICAADRDINRRY